MDSQETTSMEGLDNVGISAKDETVTESAKNAVLQSKGEILDYIKKLAQSTEIPGKQELDSLKQNFYRIHKAEVSEKKAAFVAAGGNPDEFVPETDADEQTFKEWMRIIKEKRAEIMMEQERIKSENLQKKFDILDKIKAMISSPEEANQHYNEFKELQTEWKNISNVPADKVNELWKNYQLYTEQFYDLLKLNHEFREYDFKKNLEIKTHLCEAAEKLAEEDDVISAFQQLQTLHQEYKETGPVAKELRDEIWNRFKNASTIINKKHQQYFEDLKMKEEENLSKKTELCTKIEGINLDELKTFADWEQATQNIIQIQAEWKSIGFAPQKMNVKIFERFRSACDRFFEQKAAFFKYLKENQNKNLELKKALCEKAEALKDSTDWKATGDILTKLQKEWKTIGPIPKKYSESLWKRFIGACDYFFEQKGKATSSVQSQENENLEKKKNIIEQLKNIAVEEIDEMAETVRNLAKEWNETGHVPFKEKDKIYAEYRELADKLFDAINKSNAKRRINNFRSNLKSSAEKGGNALNRERDRLVRAYENMKNEIKTYENNLGFLSSNSKKGNSLVNELNKKVEKLKEELTILSEKIKAIDEEKNK